MQITNNLTNETWVDLMFFFIGQRCTTTFILAVSEQLQGNTLFPLWHDVFFLLQQICFESLEVLTENVSNAKESKYVALMLPIQHSKAYSTLQMPFLYILNWLHMHRAYKGLRLKRCTNYPNKLMCIYREWATTIGLNSLFTSASDWLSFWCHFIQYTFMCSHCVNNMKFMECAL